MLPDDTQPKRPTGLDDALLRPVSPDETNPRRPTQPFPPPSDYLTPTITIEERGSSWMGNLLALAVLGMSSLLCLFVITLAGFAGVRDAYNTVGTEAVRTREADIAAQYNDGLEDIAAGRYELGAQRFAYIQTLAPEGYQDSAARLSQLQMMLSATPTPSPTVEPTQEISPTAQITPTLTLTPRTGLDPAEMYGNGVSAMSALDYEDAIRWFEALILVDPSYRRTDTRQQLVNALISQGRIYLRGQNDDGEDQLARGVQLITRASEISPEAVSGELLYEADFVARYLAGRSYVEGGAYGDALGVLGRLCEENCDWAYRGVSVRDLLTRAGGSAP